ncbi:MAG: hypothetical protein M3P18_10920, partial [Actinomycetota bacterium]|nr:hypothetical protein [Actinomycetota bacterium]
MPASAVLALVIAAGALVAYRWNHENSPQPNRTAQTASSTPSPTPPPLKQAKWHVVGFPAGVTADTTKRDRRTARRQAVRASRMIEAVFNGLFLEAGDLRPVVRSTFRGAAANAFLHAKTKLPHGMTRVQTIRRTIHIGVDARSAKRAAAKVTILLRGRLRSRRARIIHH